MGTCSEKRPITPLHLPNLVDKFGFDCMKNNGTCLKALCKVYSLVKEGVKVCPFHFRRWTDALVQLVLILSALEFEGTVREWRVPVPT